MDAFLQDGPRWPSCITRGILPTFLSLSNSVPFAGPRPLFLLCGSTSRHQDIVIISPDFVPWTRKNLNTMYFYMNWPHINYANSSGKMHCIPVLVFPSPTCPLPIASCVDSAPPTSWVFSFEAGLSCNLVLGGNASSYGVLHLRALPCRTHPHRNFIDFPILCFAGIQPQLSCNMQPVNEKIDYMPF